MSEKYYITTPIYYPSGKLHIGNAYTTVACDAVARYMRRKGKDVFFLTGSDEHGQKIQRKAQEAGVSPKEYVDNIVESIKELWQVLNISYDKYIRTTDDEHKKVVQEFLQKLYEQGDIYKSEYEGWYCTPCEAFWTETQLGEGNICPDCGRKVEKAKEESYFFKMSKYQDRLIAYIKEHEDFIQPVTRRNEMLSFLEQGLDDLCISRTTFDWGIPVPFDEKHVVYVWMDALTNYVSALGYTNGDPKYWPADVHMVGKDIVRFHTVIWPTILMALDMPLPKQVHAHGWLLFDGGKMSKSKGNIVDPVILSQRYGVDAVRYFVLREMQFGQDGNYSSEALLQRINIDLANDLGNLVSRTVSMVEKYFGGTCQPTGAAEEVDADLKTMAEQTLKTSSELIESIHLASSLTEIWKLISRTNKYIDETAPWVLAKDEAKKDRLMEVMQNLCECIRLIAVMIAPFMPDTCERILEQLGTKDQTMVWQNEGYTVHKGEVLFPRLDVEKELEALEALSV